MPKPVYILGLTGFSDYHDNSAALVKDGRVVFAISEERLTRQKHDSSFPVNSIKAALDFAGIQFSDLAYVVSGWPKRSLVKVFGKKHLIADVVKSLGYLGVRANVRLVPFGLKLIIREKQAGEMSLDKFFTERSRSAGQVLSPGLRLPPPWAGSAQSRIEYVDHHQAHASSAYRSSGFPECLAVTLDGFGATMDGDLRSGSVWVCANGEMREVESIPIECSMGLFYEAVTVALGFKPADGEGKTMGLAAYGDPVKVYREVKRIAPSFKNGKWTRTPWWLDTIFSVDLAYKSLFDRTRMGTKLLRLIKEHGQEQVAAAAQRVLEEEVVRFFKYLHNKYKYSKIAASGGVFLNVKMNKKILQLKEIEDLFVYPNAGDGGVAVGAALEAYENLETEKLRNGKTEKHRNSKRLESAALGVKFSEQEIKSALKKFNGQISYRRIPYLPKYVGKALTNGKVVGWFQGRDEWGPRALGQRSVLADPRDAKTKERINDLMKKRDWFMPFAPAIMEEHVQDWFVDGYLDPFMTMAFDVVKGKEKKLAAAIHIDNTARPQVVSKKVNPKYWQVIESFYQLTGVPVILNTSFNKHGLPIVHSPEDAVEHLLWGCVDELAIGDYLVKKS